MASKTGRISKKSTIALDKLLAGEPLTKSDRKSLEHLLASLSKYEGIEDYVVLMRALL